MATTATAGSSLATQRSSPVPRPHASSTQLSTANPPAEQAATQHERPNRKKVRLCRYFGTGSGCRADRNCQFVHDPSRLSPDLLDASLPTGQHPGNTQISHGQQAVIQPVTASRIVPRPVPKTQLDNPREFQLGQVRKRYSPKEKRHFKDDGVEDGDSLTFSLVPSDPDFPFEMNALECMLIVPAGHPGSVPKSKPRLKVKNQEIPRGFAINIERGFDGLVEERKDATLLVLISALDKHLETFLSEKKAETVKLVANSDRRHLANLPVRAVGTPERPPSHTENVDASLYSQAPLKPVKIYTAVQKADAEQRRQSETRQLEARLGRLPLYKKSSDGIAYTLPLEPRRRPDLPFPLQVVKSMQLFVPLLYPLEYCRINLDGIKREDARNVETAFEDHANQMKDMTLIAHVNYLAQNIHTLAKNLPKSMHMAESPLTIGEKDVQSRNPTRVDDLHAVKEIEDVRSHIKIIPRPPEWTVNGKSDLSDTDDDYSYDSEIDSEVDPEAGGVEVEHSDPELASIPLKNPEKGTAMSFPFIELYGIELLEVTGLNLAIRCERCKDTIDVINLKTHSPKNESCKKCAAVLKVCFRRDFIHANAVRAGFIDLERCTVVDMLPSTFNPTCSNCSTTYPAPGIISVRGETATNVCRECHQKFTFKIPSVKFLRITTSALPPSSGPRRKREMLGLVTGTELPDRGRCRHYSKSYRWFRFSCCGKVYPCDKCHDEKEEHPNEHANRMICGWCSREQTYRPEDCNFCGRWLVGRKGHGFWEGGKGTRDKVRMSRKDPRKHRRIGAEGKAKGKD